MPIRKSSWLVISTFAFLAILLQSNDVEAWTNNSFSCPPTSLQCQNQTDQNTDSLGNYEYRGELTTFGTGIIASASISLYTDTPNSYPIRWALVAYPSLNVIKYGDKTVTLGVEPVLVDFSLDQVVSSGQYFIGIIQHPYTGGVLIAAAGNRSNPFTVGKCFKLTTTTSYIPSSGTDCTSSSWDVGFYITGTANGSGWLNAPIPPPIVSCGSTDYVCQIGNWFSTQFTNLISWLFVPPADVFSPFTNLWSSISNKPPIGYFTQIETSLSGLTVASGSYYLTFSGLDSGASPLAPLKTGMVWIMWLLLAFWILHRIRLLEV